MSLKNNALWSAAAFMAFMLLVVFAVSFIIFKNMGPLYFWVYLLTGTVSALVFSFLMYRDIKDEIKLDFWIDEAP